MAFVELSDIREDHGSVHVNSSNIAWMRETDDGNTEIRFVDGWTVTVKEPPEDIRKIIDTEWVRIKNRDTGTRTWKGGNDG